MKKNKGCLFLLSFAIFLFVIVPICAITLGGQSLNTSNQADNKNIIKIDEISNEESEKIENILKECGFNNIKKIEHDELLDNAHFDGEKGYRVESNGIKNIILYLNKDNTVNILKYADYELYKQDKIVANIRDISFTDEEKNKLYIQVEDLVKNTLKSPSTAKFPNITEWMFGKDKENITIQSYVDAQNALGATIRSEFQVTLSLDNKDIKSFILDGKEYIK